MLALQDITPDVEVFSVDEAFLDVTHCQRFWKKGPEYIARLVGTGNKTRPLRAVGDADRAAAQRGFILLLNRRKEGVHIDKDDRAWPM